MGAPVTAAIDVGVQDTIAALRAWAERTHKATETGVHEAGTKLKDVIENTLELYEYPPSSPPGAPPARRTGALQGSVRQRTVELGTGFQERVYPSIVYARIHELSGWTGAGHRTFLPKRPYVGPSLDVYGPEFRPAMLAAWSDALPGR